MAPSTSLRRPAAALSLPILLLASSSSSSDAAPSYTYLPAEEIVRDHLPMQNAGIEFRNVVSSSQPCFSFMTNGHSAGKIDRGEEDGDDTNDEMIRRRRLRGTTTTAERQLWEYALPDEGLVLISRENPLESSTSGTNQASGEPLDDLVEGRAKGACYVQFDFLCPKDSAGFLTTNTVEVRYVFGSNEYYNTVRDPGGPHPGSSANGDAFGIFLNGENIARLPDPDGDDPVSVHTVNGAENTDHFVTNNGEYDGIRAPGFTTRLEAREETSPGWNTLRFAVGHEGDSLLNSWAIVEAGSLSCGRKGILEDPWKAAYDKLNGIVNESGEMDGKWGVPMPVAVMFVAFLGLVALSLPLCAFGSTNMCCDACGGDKGDMAGP